MTFQHFEQHRKNSLVPPQMETPAPSGVVLGHSFQIPHEVKDGGKRGAHLVRVDCQESKPRSVQHTSKILRAEKAFEARLTSSQNHGAILYDDRYLWGHEGRDMRTKPALALEAGELERHAQLKEGLPAEH